MARMQDYYSHRNKHEADLNSRVKELCIDIQAKAEEIERESALIIGFKEKVGSFVEDIKGRSVIYNMVKILPIWKELEELIIDRDSVNEETEE